MSSFSRHLEAKIVTKTIFREKSMHRATPLQKFCYLCMIYCEY